MSAIANVRTAPGAIPVLVSNLRKAFRKLGVKSRTQLASRMRG